MIPLHSYHTIYIPRHDIRSRKYQYHRRTEHIYGLDIEPFLNIFILDFLIFCLLRPRFCSLYSRRKLLRMAATLGSGKGPSRSERADECSTLHSMAHIKLTGRAFYESLGSPKIILAPMVDQSEFVCFFLLFCTPIVKLT